MQIKVKNILSSVLFLLGLLVLLIAVSLFFQPKNNTEAHGMEDAKANGILGEPEGTIDVLFIGDSVSYCSVIPMQIWRDYGITSYMCGTSLQQLYYSKEFLYKTFKTQSPKIVMLEGTPIFNNFMYKENIRTAIERKLPVFRYHDRWKTFGTMLELDTDLRVEYTHQEIAKGYYYSPAVEVVDAGDYTKPTDEVAGVLEDNKRTLVEIIEFCKENGAELILYSAPNALTWTPSGHNALVQLAEELGLTYFDMNYMPEDVPIDWSMDSFDGGDHLNYAGAQKVTSYLGRYLAEKGIFADKRGDERYKTWDDAKKEFYQSVVN